GPACNARVRAGSDHGGFVRRGHNPSLLAVRRDPVGNSRAFRPRHALRGDDRTDPRPPDALAAPPLPAGGAGPARGGEGNLVIDPGRPPRAGASLGDPSGGIRGDTLVARWSPLQSRGGRLTKPSSQSRVPQTLVAGGVALLLAGSFWGLFKAPSEVFMGDVQRIMYVHVPTAWNAMLALTFAFVCAIAFLFTNSWKWDNRLEAATEMGVVLSLLLCMQGAIWAKPTWGVWWDWDPR